MENEQVTSTRECDSEKKEEGGNKNKFVLFVTYCGSVCVCVLFKSLPAGGIQRTFFSIGTQVDSHLDKNS